MKLLPQTLLPQSLLPQSLLPCLIAIVGLAGCNNQPSYRDETVALTTVQNVDLERYQGTWYEIARLPNRFEKNCEGVTATYGRRKDGLISVINECRVGGVNGRIKTAKGRAKVVDSQSNAKLKVSFFGPFWGDYWIIDLDSDYSLALIGEPSGKYLWMLSRTPTLAPARLELALRKLQTFGYDTNALYFTKQPPGSKK